jgi:hypothetical protein
MKRLKKEAFWAEKWAKSEVFSCFFVRLSFVMLFIPWVLQDVLKKLFSPGSGRGGGG